MFLLVASCMLHGLEVECYFTDVVRVLPYWLRDRYLELDPKFQSTGHQHSPLSTPATSRGPSVT